MLITIIAVAIGVVIGLLRGGSLGNLRGVHVAWWPVLAVGVALQAAAETFDLPGALSLSVIGMFLILVGLGLNSQIRGAFVAGVGVLSNLLVTVANGHVPIRFEALQEAGLVGPEVTPDAVTVGGIGELETADTRLAVLGDVIPLDLFGTVISFGDLITLAGIIVIAQNLLVVRHRVGITVDELFGPDPEPTVIDLDQRRSTPAPLDLREPAPPAPVGQPAGVDLDSPFEPGPVDQRPFDYGDPDDFGDFDEGISTIRPMSR